MTDILSQVLRKELNDSNTTTNMGAQLLGIIRNSFAIVSIKYKIEHILPARDNLETYVYWQTTISSYHQTISIENRADKKTGAPLQVLRIPPQLTIKNKTKK